MRDLVIIESPGKSKTLYGLFAKIGLPVDIVATIGHIRENPTNLKKLAIRHLDGAFVETERTPHRPDSFAYLRDRLLRSDGRILVATDNDQEGHVIASDVVSLIEDLRLSRPVYRMLLAGLDEDNLRAALEQLTPVDREASIPGTARRFVDRIIGGCLSDFENNRPVGRVQSAMLGLVQQGIPSAYVTVDLPAADGGANFKGSVPLVGIKTPAQLIAELGLSSIPPLPVGEALRAPMTRPLNYGDAVLELNAQCSMDVERAAQLLQEMYEAGEITYPRTRARAFTHSGAACIQKLAKSKGIMLFRSAVLPLLDKQDDEPHEAIRLLNDRLLDKLDLGKPLGLQPSERDAARVLIARRSLTSGISIKRDCPDLTSAPAWMNQIDWHRDSKVALPWRETKPDHAEVQSVDLKSSLVKEMMAHELGKPSTWVNHAARFERRQLVDDHHQLNSRGKALFDSAPEVLRDPSSSRELERLLDRGHLGTDALILDALQALGEVSRGRILEQLTHEYEASLGARPGPIGELDEDELELRIRPSF